MTCPIHIDTPLDPQDFGFLDPDRKNMRSMNPDLREEISTKNCKKREFLFLKPKYGLLKYFDNSAVLNKFSKSVRNDYDLDPDPFFSNRDPGSGSASKLNGS